MTETPIAKHPFDLEKRTLTFAKQVIRLCKNIPLDVINKEIVGQLIRASGSIGANYREANDALSKKDFAHRIKIARRETKETIYWLQLLVEANPTIHLEADELLQEALELKKILSSIADKVSP